MPATRTFEVPDIHCGHCKSAIEGEVGQVDGVDRVDVDVDTRRVTVEGKATDDAIRAAILEAGYEAVGT